MKTYSAKPTEIERKWYVIDATDKIVGQVAVEAANLLRGKLKPLFTPHIDCGDHVVIINAEKAVFTGRKNEQKIYTRFSGYVGGKTVETPNKLRARRPELILQKAITGMLQHNRLGRAQARKLNVYVGSEHPHEAQQPEAYEVA